jgi:hypothetical protein
MQALKKFLTPVSILILSGVALFDHLGPHRASAPMPASSVDGVVLGKAYAPALVSTYGDAWMAAAKALEDGKPIAEAQKALQDTWKDARIKAFTSQVAPSFARVLPEGAEPSAPQKRAEVVELWRSFARGLKRGR